MYIYTYMIVFSSIVNHIANNKKKDLYIYIDSSNGFIHTHIYNQQTTIYIYIYIYSIPFI